MKNEETTAELVKDELLGKVILRGKHEMCVKSCTQFFDTQSQCYELQTVVFKAMMSAKQGSQERRDLMKKRVDCPLGYRSHNS